jgi:hypothetical protein
LCRGPSRIIHRVGPHSLNTAWSLEDPAGSLCADGNGEVYRARDARLARTVAINVRPEQVSADPELKQRFEHWAVAALGAGRSRE